MNILKQNQKSIQLYNFRVPTAYWVITIQSGRDLTDIRDTIHPFMIPLFLSEKDQ